jgi:AcrR family transcriptional regulator
MRSAPSLRERKKAKTKGLLESIALDLFERKGFEEATVAEIADAADVSPRTLFRYYPHKVDLVFAAAEEFRKQLRESLVGRPRTERSFEALKNALLEFSHYVEEERERVRRGMRLVATSASLRKREAEEVRALTTMLVDTIAEREGAAEPALEHLTIALLTLGCATAAFETWLASSELQLPELLAESFVVAETELCRAGARC